MKQTLLYEGKAKKVFDLGDGNCVVEFKNTATAFNGEKKQDIEGKGRLNCLITASIFDMLAQNGIKTHLIKLLDDTRILAKRIEIVPLEVIVRNIAAGSFCKRFGVKEGTVLREPTLEYCLKDDALGDPMINDSHILALGICTRDELAILADVTMKINALLIEYFKKAALRLVDFKIEFGRAGGEIYLADEISPDTCRLWDDKTNEKLDKDRFRLNLGNVENAYKEVFDRIK